MESYLEHCKNLLSQISGAIDGAAFRRDDAVYHAHWVSRLGSDLADTEQEVLRQFILLSDEIYLRSIIVCGGGTTPRKRHELQRKLEKNCEGLKTLLTRIIDNA